MPRSGDTDTNYPQRLLDIGLTILDPFKGAKKHHLLMCNACSHQWTATPLSKLQNFKRYGASGCPNCHRGKQGNTKSISRAKNIQILLDKGLTIVSDWDGRRRDGRNNIATKVTVFNPTCGHTFTSTAINLLCTDLTCAVCGSLNKVSAATAWSKANSEEWKKTATEWRVYKSKVTSLTKVSYRDNIGKINPNNNPTGRAGTEGAYHIDHIVPIRYCYDNNIPEELCAHPDNLQMLGWRENVGSRDKLKSYVPTIFESYVS
jgi:hypothetical protein